LKRWYSYALAKCDETDHCAQGSPRMIEILLLVIIASLIFGGAAIGQFLLTIIGIIVAVLAWSRIDALVGENWGWVFAAFGGLVLLAVAMVFVPDVMTRILGSRSVVRRSRVRSRLVNDIKQWKEQDAKLVQKGFAPSHPDRRALRAQIGQAQADLDWSE
jgi:hypothetical protein